ncbi:ABC transporter permease, partial [Vibrio furnissii]
MNSLYRIKAVMVKEFRQLSRDRITFGMVVMIPLIQLILFGFAINTDVRNIPVAVVDQSQSTFGRLLTESIKVSQVVDLTHAYT